MSSPRIEEYLEEIFKIQEKTKQPANISRIAENLELSVPSASEMMKKLAESGTISYNKQREVSLTEEGFKQAGLVVRRHRLAERFLTDILGLSWDQVHSEACLFEHAISPLVEKKLAQKLGNPLTCPHGNPIPDASGQPAKLDVTPLSALKPGQTGQVVLITDESSDILKYLTKLNLVPNTDVKIDNVAPFGGPITILIENKSQAIGPELAGKIMVRPKNR